MERGSVFRKRNYQAAGKPSDSLGFTDYPLLPDIVFDFCGNTTSIINKILAFFYRFVFLLMSF